MKNLPLDEMVAAYKKQFELYAELKRELDDINSSLISSDERLRRARDAHARAWTKGLEHSRAYNWDEDWDGMLIQKCYSLQEAGFTVTRFYRKLKICLALPKPYPPRAEILQMLLQGAGDDWVGCSFKPQISVWWQSNSRTFGGR